MTFKFIYENILGCESGARTESIHEKKLRLKILCKCIFKVAEFQLGSNYVQLCSTVRVYTKTKMRF